MRRILLKSKIGPFLLQLIFLILKVSNAISLKLSQMKKLLALTVVAGIFTGCNKDNSPPVVKPLTFQNFTPYTDGPGAPVTITGSSFGYIIGNITVSFNGTVANIISTADTVLVVTVPEGGKDGKISVSVNKQTVHSSQDFIFLKGVWIKRADLIGPGEFKLGSTGFSIDGKGYVAFGSTFNNIYDTASNDVGLYQYDTLFKTWTRKADLPGSGRHEAAVAVTAGKAFLIGGSIDDIVGQELWTYDPAIDQWSQKASFPGLPRVDATAFTINDKIYFGTGNGLNYQDRDWWQYDPATDIWTQKADFPGTFPRAGSGFSIEGKGFLGIGVDSNEWWQYDATTDVWTRKADFPLTVKYASGSFVIAAKGYIVAGSNSSTWEYDPANDSWTQKTSFYQPRDAGYSFSISNLGYFGCGSNPDYGLYLNKDCWTFDPQ